MIAIIDYGSGNVHAVSTLLEKQNIKHCLTDDIVTLKSSDKYILPGVGAFDPSMKTLRETGLLETLNEEVLVNKKPVLGICVGMHLLSEGSDEGQEVGLGWISGRVRKIQLSEDMPPPRLPHMGWNSINPKKDTPLFNNIDMDHGFYFLHSYYFDAANSADIAAEVEFGSDMTCAVIKDNMFGMQFHPEKSHSNGMKLFSNFAAL